MSMTDAGLSAAIKGEIISRRGAPADDAELQQFCDAVGTAVVDYIKANAEVTVTGVQSGGASASGTIS